MVQSRFNHSTNSTDMNPHQRVILTFNCTPRSCSSSTGSGLMASPYSATVQRQTHGQGHSPGQSEIEQRRIRLLSDWWARGKCVPGIIHQHTIECRSRFIQRQNHGKFAIAAACDWNETNTWAVIKSSCSCWHFPVDRKQHNTWCGDKSAVYWYQHETSSLGGSCDGWAAAAWP